MRAFIVCMLSFFGLEMSNLPTDVFFTCSSNRLMMAWTHSTGLCAAMLRRMRAPLCLLSITFAIPIPALDSPRERQIPPKPLRKITKEENRGGGGGRRGVWFSFSLQAYSTTPPWHTTGSLNPHLWLWLQSGCCACADMLLKNDHYYGRNIYLSLSIYLS